MLTDEQRDALNEAICLARDDGLPGTEDHLRALLAAHSAGAQEPVGTAVNDEELGRFWEMHKPASEFPVGTHVYTHPQPVTQTDAARDAFRALIAKVPHKPQAITYEKGWELLDELQRIAEIERIDRARGSDER